jgi:hypothetical protein
MRVTAKLFHQLGQIARDSWGPRPAHSIASGRRTELQGCTYQDSTIPIHPLICHLSNTTHTSDTWLFQSIFIYL